jgi:glycosyltransferase involved in cell wall biosynthesis
MSMLVSILIPAYNSEKWISDAIQSAMDQTWPKKEIIVVDDGSRDSTLRIARSFESDTVKVIGQDNRGASAARNKALSFAQGDYIQWLDADDVLAPDKVAWQLRDAEDGKTSRVLRSSAWGRFYYRKSQAKFIPNSLWQDLTPTEWIYGKLDENAWMAIESWLVSRKLTELGHPWDESLSMDDDGEYFCRIVGASEKILFVPEAKSFCRNGNLSSISSCADISGAKLDSQFKSMRRHIDCLLSLEDSKRTRVVCIKYLQRWLIDFYPERPEIVQEARALASKLGGDLSLPSQRWKYGLIRRVFGWRASKQAQRLMPAARVLLERDWDALLFRLNI